MMNDPGEAAEGPGGQIPGEGHQLPQLKGGPSSQATNRRMTAKMRGDGAALHDLLIATSLRPLTCETSAGVQQPVRALCDKNCLTLRTSSTERRISGSDTTPWF